MQCVGERGEEGNREKTRGGILIFTSIKCPLLIELLSLTNQMHIDTEQSPNSWLNRYYLKIYSFDLSIYISIYKDLMCTFRASCYSARLSWALVLSLVSPYVKDKIS